MSHLGLRPKESILKAETFFVTSRNGDRKIMQSIRITSRPPLWISKRHQLSLFRLTSTKVIPIEKNSASYVSAMSQGFKRGRKWRTNSSTYPFLQLIYQFQAAARSTSPDMTKVFHARLNGRFIEMQGKLRRKKIIERMKTPFFNTCYQAQF